jgi:hypothetical protein
MAHRKNAQISQSQIDSTLQFLWGGAAPAGPSGPAPAAGVGGEVAVSSNPKRQQVVSIAKAHVGEGAGDDYKKFLEGTVQTSPGNNRVHWCGIYALWVLHQVGILTDVKWIWGRSFLGKLPETKNPKPGDLGYKDSFQHHNIIVGVEDDHVFTIDGNSIGGKVTGPNKQPKSAFRSFFSIGPYVGEQVAEASKINSLIKMADRFLALAQSADWTSVLTDRINKSLYVFQNKEYVKRYGVVPKLTVRYTMATQPKQPDVVDVYGTDNQAIERVRNIIQTTVGKAISKFGADGNVIVENWILRTPTERDK